MPTIKRQSPKPGDPIRASDMAAIWDAIDKLNFELAPPLARSGRVIYIAGQRDTPVPAFVTATTTTRSGSTPGEGTVAFAEWDGTDFTEGDEEVDVKNLLVIASSVAIGKVVWVRFWQGEHWIVSGECPDP